jgi:hypothetical protein
MTNSLSIALSGVICRQSAMPGQARRLGRLFSGVCEASADRKGKRFEPRERGQETIEQWVVA